VKISQIVPVIKEELVIVMITILAKVICNCNDYIFECNHNINDEDYIQFGIGTKNN